MNAQSIISSGIIYNSFNELKCSDKVPLILKDIYKQLKHDEGIKINEWNIISLNESNDYNYELNQYDIYHIHNFAILYMGMGWVMVAAVNLDNEKVFIRYEGGSNGYDVQGNLNKTINYINNEKIKKYLSLEKFFSMIYKQVSLDDLKKYVL